MTGLPDIYAAPTLDAAAAALADRGLAGAPFAGGTWIMRAPLRQEPFKASYVALPSAATVNMNADGSETLVTSGVEIGSGSMMQALPQLVAGALGLTPDQVIVRPADTDAAGFDVGVGGGRTTVSLGAAGLSAAQEVKTKLLKVAGEMLEVEPDLVVMKDSRIDIAGSNGFGYSIAEVAARAQTKHYCPLNDPLSGHL